MCNESKNNFPNTINKSYFKVLIWSWSCCLFHCTSMYSIYFVPYILWWIPMPRNVFLPFPKLSSDFSQTESLAVQTKLLPWNINILTKLFYLFIFYFIFRHFVREKHSNRFVFSIINGPILSSNWSRWIFLFLYSTPCPF